MRTISIVNQKGGCGKTTTAVNIATAFAQTGRNVLLVDLDPQAHVTSGLGHNPDSFEGTIYDALMSGDGFASNIIVSTNVPGLDLAPCNVLLANAEAQLAGVAGAEKLLSRCLDDLRDSYDLCVIDCPPSLGILTANALAASDVVIVPVAVQYHGLAGLRRLLETVELIQGRGRSSAAGHCYILPTFVEDRGSLSRQVQQELRDSFGGLVLHTVIHRNIKLAESPAVGVPVLIHAPQSRGAADYRTLAHEVLTGRRPDEEPQAEPARQRRPKRLTALFSGPGSSRRALPGWPSTLGSFETT